MRPRTVHVSATWCQLFEGAVWASVFLFCAALVLLAPPTRLLVTGRSWCQHTRSDCDLCLQLTRGAWYEGERASMTCGPLDRDCLDRAQTQVCR